MNQPYPIALIGAAGGIGSELAKSLSQEGFPLLLLGRQAEPLNQLANELSSPTQVQTVDARDRAALLAAIKGYGAPLHGLVNLAGSIVLKPAQRTTPEDFQSVLNDNLITAFNTVAVAQGSMAKGSVVLMSSVAAQTGLMNHEAIAAAKAGVEGLTRAAAATGVRKGLRFNAVAPALVDTPLAAGILASDAARQASNRMHPLGRVGQAKDIANVIAMLLKPENDWITGQVQRIDGGLGSVRTPG